MALAKRAEPQPPPDVHDPETQQVLEAIADRLVESLARQAARSNFARQTRGQG
jgi:hypothetical protein